MTKASAPITREELWLELDMMLFQKIHELAELEHSNSILYERHKEKLASERYRMWTMRHMLEKILMGEEGE